jgi:hypothetical protein
LKRVECNILGKQAFSRTLSVVENPLEQNILYSRLLSPNYSISELCGI